MGLGSVLGAILGTVIPGVGNALGAAIGGAAEAGIGAAVGGEGPAAPKLEEVQFQPQQGGNLLQQMSQMAQPVVVPSLVAAPTEKFAVTAMPKSTARRGAAGSRRQGPARLAQTVRSTRGLTGADLTPAAPTEPEFDPTAQGQQAQLQAQQEQEMARRAIAQQNQDLPEFDPTAQGQQAQLQAQQEQEMERRAIAQQNQDLILPEGAAQRQAIAQQNQDLILPEPKAAKVAKAAPAADSSGISTADMINLGAGAAGVLANLLKPAPKGPAPSLGAASFQPNQDLLALLQQMGGQVITPKL